MKKTSLMIFLSLLLAAQTAVAAERIVSCEINSNGKTVFNGKCKFIPDQGGSFSLSGVTGKPLFGNVTDVSVYIIEKGVAEVRGLTSDGINSRWGEAKRSAKDKACWEGSDFRVCAR
jgi:hypothetical protein